MISFHFSYFLFYKSQLKSEIPTFASSSSRSCITNNKFFAYYRRYCDDTEEIDIAFSFVPSCSVCDTCTAKKSTLTSTYKVSSFITIKAQLISINLFLHTDGTLNTYLSICSPSVHPAFRLFVVYRRRRFIVVVRPYTCRKSGESLHVIPFFSFSIFCFAFILYIFLFIFIYDFSLHNSDMFYFCEFRYCRWFHRLLCFYRSNYLLYCTTFVVFSHALTISLIYAYVLNSQILYSFICRICIQAVFILTSDVYIKYYINS